MIFLLLIVVAGNPKVVVKANRVNIHFENKLANQPVSKNYNFDFVYFLLNQSDIPLYTEENFDESYIDFLKSLGFQTRYTSKADQLIDWWVEDETSEITKQLNSKVFVQQYLLANNLSTSESLVVNNLNEFNDQIDRFNLIREEFSVSGRGTYRKGEKTPQYFPVLLTNLKERVCDIGVRVRGEQVYTYYNLVDQQFCFRGQFFDRSDKFLNANKSLFNQLSSLSGRLSLLMKKDYQVQDFQFDSFLYKCGNEIALEFAHEINYRKSMGDIYLNLKDRGLVENNYGLLLYSILSKNKPFQEVSDKFLSSQNEIIPLSPMKKGLNLFFIQSESVDGLLRNLDRLYQEMGLSRKAVYNDMVNTIKRISVHDER